MSSPRRSQIDHNISTSTNRTGNVHQEMCGNLNLPEFGLLGSVNEDGSVQFMPGGYNVPESPFLAPVDPLSGPWFITTIASSALGSLRSWADQNIAAPEQGGAHPAVDTQEAPPHQSSVADIHSAPEGTFSSEGARVWESVGNVSTVPVENGATNSQSFHDIDENVLKHLSATPASATIPADAVAKPGETLIGRVIGNLNTGHIGPNGTSQQTFGSAQVSVSASRQGYSRVYAPQRSQASTPTFTISGPGQTLGQAPAGIRPSAGGRRK